MASTTNIYALPVTVSLPTSEGSVSVNIEDLYYHTQAKPTVPNSVIALLQSGSVSKMSEWLTLNPPELTSPLGLLRVWTPTDTLPFRRICMTDSVFLNQVPYRHGSDCVSKFKSTVSQWIRILLSYLASIDKAVAEGEPVPLIDYANLVQTIVRITADDKPDHEFLFGSTAMTRWEDGFGKNGWLNGVLWGRYFRHVLDRDVPAYSSMTEVSEKEQVDAVRNFVGGQIMCLRHLMMDIRDGEYKGDNREDGLVNVQINMKSHPREQ